MNVTGGRETADGPDLVRDPADLGEMVAVVAVERLVLDALHHSERTPRDMVVDRGELSGLPDESLDGERRLGVQHMADEVGVVASALLVGEQVDAGHA
jgi:hypothetical protein